MSDQINLGQLLGNGHKYELTVGNEPPEDAAARRTKDQEDDNLKRKMTFILFNFALVMIGVIFLGCIADFIYGSPEDKKWVTGIISAMTSGLIGFLVGQGKK